ncbi:MAG: flagellar hook-length control protein FliK [Candidatus Eremiobacteraeota bacterium]|nr:flagellar hook-length control protein FliK [Candidatus Eremiobacteraeota bacterium]
MAFLLNSTSQAGAASHASGHRPARPQTTSLFDASTFGSMLSGQMDALGAADPLAALTALVQNGTSTSTVISNLAGQIADAVQRQLPGQFAGTSRQQLVDSIEAALSPPGKAPPGTTAAQETAALARRLQNWMNGVAREAERAGQQSDTSGQVLDANRARELPAQHDSEATIKGTDVSSLVRSLIASVVAALPASTPGVVKPTLPATPSTTPASLEAALADAVAAHVASTPSAQASASAPASSTSNGAPTAPATARTAATGAQTPADLLARMLVRAAGVDARVNGSSSSSQAANAGMDGTRTDASTDASNATAAAVVRPPSDETTPLSPTTADRLTAILAEAVGASAESSGGGSPFEGQTSSHDFEKSLAAALPDQPAKSAGPATTDTPAFAVPAAPAAPSSPLIQQQQAASSANGSLADPNAVVEQVVKAMTMRTIADGVSQMHLRLHPDGLGSVTLKLTVNGTSVSATAIAQNADVRSALVSQQHHLARSLSESGLKLTGFSVDLSGGDAGSDRRDRTAGFGRKYSVHEVAGTEEPDSNEGLTSGPPLVPGSTVALLNYLA